MSWLGDEINYNIRWYKPNDPYYWEVDNLPIQDLQDNCIKLQGQLNNIPDWGGFNTVAIFDDLFLNQITYNARRLEELEGIDLISNPENDDVFINVGGAWNPSGFFKNPLNLGHQLADSTTRGLEDVIISNNPTVNPPAVLKYNGTTKVWEDGIDRNFSTVLSHEGGYETGALKNYDFVNWTSPTEFTNEKVVPTFDTALTPTQGTIFIYEGAEYKQRELIDDSFYDNFPGQHGPFTRDDGVNLLRGTDSSMSNTWYGGALTYTPYFKDPYGISLTSEEVDVWRTDAQRQVAYLQGPDDSVYFQKMATNTQGAVFNWTAFKSQTALHHEVIVLEDNPDFDDNFPQGVRYLSGWAHQRIHDLFLFEASKLTFQYVGFFTGHENDDDRICATLCTVDHRNGADVMERSKDTEVAIPVDDRGAYDGTNYIHDGKHRVYLDVNTHNEYYRNPPAGGGEEDLPTVHSGYSFLRVNINGWIT